MHHRSVVLYREGEPTGLRLRKARGFLRRLIGFWPTPRWHSVDVVEFPQCTAIHTFCMAAAIDVIFVDAHSRVSKIVPCLQPWRWVSESSAVAVFEFRAGYAALLDIRVGTLLTAVEISSCSSRYPKSLVSVKRHRARGSSMLEFTVAVGLVVLPLISGILEFSQLATARQLLAIATSEAARASAIADMDGRSAIVRFGTPLLTGDQAIRATLARGLIPLLGVAYPRDADLQTGPQIIAEALAEATDPSRVRVTLSKQLVVSADIEVDRLDITYCRELFFAPASYLMPVLMKSWSDDVFERACYDANRVPITVQSPMSRSRFP